MKFLSSWTVRPDTRLDAVRQFLAGGGMPPSGATLLGRWHRVDASGGVSLFETSDAAVLFEHAADWARFLDIEIVPVVEDAEAGPLMAKILG